MSRDVALGVIQGTLDVLVLKALSAGPQHGYGISAWVHRRTEGELDIEDGALYQALHRLEHRGWIEAEWGLSDNKRRARFYRLTRCRLVVLHLLVRRDVEQCGSLHSVDDGAMCVLGHGELSRSA